MECREEKRAHTCKHRNQNEKKIVGKKKHCFLVSLLVPWNRVTFDKSKSCVDVSLDEKQ